MNVTAQKRLSALEVRIGYVFKDKALGLKALTHSSYGDGKRKVEDNERLEFLGDRVLGLLTAGRIFELCQEREGSMARRLNGLVRKETCAAVAREVDLGGALLVSPSEDRQGGREKLSILGDACEALIAAIYLDGGLDAAQKFFDRFWAQYLEKLKDHSKKDPKTELQERAAVLGVSPVYETIERTGPDHRPHFIIEVTIENIGTALGEGASKKDAQRTAALNLLKKWSEKT